MYTIRHSIIKVIYYPKYTLDVNKLQNNDERQQQLNCSSKVIKFWSHCLSSHKSVVETLKSVPSWLGNKTFVHAPLQRNGTVMGSLQNVQIYFYSTT